MRHLRLPQLLQTVPSAVAGVPGVLQGRRPRRQLIWGALGLAAIAGLIWYVASGSGPANQGPPPPPVEVAKAVQKTVSETEHTIGTIVADSTVNLTSQVAGQVMSAGFTEGQIVHKGDVLFRLDQRPFQAALDQAKANLARDRASLAAALRDKARYDALAKQNAISAQLRDQTDAQAGALTGTVKADKAAVDMAALNLGYAVIRSPIDGKTGPILIQPGNLVKANDTNALVVITQIEPIKVSFFLPQTDLPRIQTEMRARGLVAHVTPHGEGAQTLSAPVDFVGNAVNATTGTIELRATYPNTDTRLVPGELVDVSLGLSRIENAIVVPSQAVNVGPDGHYVFTVNAGSKAAMVPVKVLYDDGTDAAIRGKIKNGDTVITVGQLRVQPGLQVSVVHPGQS
ncbi:MAG: efflux RND transporter periplasmic adaptor subunit [Alphaproteobacteria bacterium]|nr:efflux RND transporter periplasmic adaptor subunit [Alphaproteobacteria bacterium]